VNAHRPRQRNGRGGTWLGLAVALIAIGGSPGRASPSPEPDPRAIMEAVAAREVGDRMSAQMRMTITSGGGKQRQRTLRTRAMKVGAERRQLVIFESPADVRNIALLSVDYDDGDRADDQWLYLPSLRKATRISGGERSGSFMGSDFSYADMTQQHTSHYDYELVDDATQVAGEDCWLIEARPRTDKARDETGYTKSHVWVSKEKKMPLQVKAWVRAGKKIKYMKFDAIEKQGGVWVAQRAAARTVEGDAAVSTTVIELRDVEVGDETVTEVDFTQRRLEQGL
jgi:outer membrane lipoprotein-sorting protein